MHTFAFLLDIIGSVCMKCLLKILPINILLIQAGVSKLNEAKALVDELNRKAGEQSVLLKTKQDEADAALQEITVSMQVMFREQRHASNREPIHP